MKVWIFYTICITFSFAEQNTFQFEQLIAQSTQIPFNLSSNNKTLIKLYQFYHQHPREIQIQLYEGSLNQKHPFKSQNIDFKLRIYEFPTENQVDLVMQNQNNVNAQFSDENIIAYLSNNHTTNHINLINDFFYIIFAEYSDPLQGELDQLDQDQSGNTNGMNIKNMDFKFILDLKFLSYKSSCNQKGEFDIEQYKCTCTKNNIGKFCENEIFPVTNYYSFEMQIKPFNGKYIQIYKVSAEDEIKLEVIIKSYSQNYVYLYRSYNSMWYPTQYQYFEKLLFNSSNTQNIISAEPNNNSVLLFVRNPSNSYLSITINIKNITIIDDTNIVFFIMISLIITLSVSFLCIFCFNKISSSGKKNLKHVELVETKEQDDNKYRQQNQQNGINPQTNRNLIEDIKTQRENQIKSEMNQITKGDKYEQFQLETSFKEQICAICLDDFEYDDVVRKTKCNHMFHEKCLYKWLFRYISCPMCNQDLT